MEVKDMPEREEVVAETIKELRGLRYVLDELNDEAKRAYNERSVMFGGSYDALFAALRENPTRETAAAYFAWHDEINSKKPYERAQEIDNRRRAVRDAMSDLHKKLHEHLGVGLVSADWEHP